MKVIIFGGSFDPIHNGHILVAKKAMHHLKAKRVYFLPAKHPRWKKNTTNDQQRLEMLQIALKDHSWAKIDLSEINSSENINYTYDTMLKIKSEHPKDELYFLIGTDQLNLLDQWYKIDELSKLVKIVCIARPSFEINETNVEKYNVEIIKDTVSDVSSTSVRSLRSLDIPLGVFNYIVKNNLYFMEKYKSYFSEKRFKHSISVSKLAYKIASSNHLPTGKALLAALLHDIGKEQPLDMQYEYLLKNYPEMKNNLSRELYHQFYSVKIAKEVFKIKDKEVLEAIKYHATGNENMSKIAKIIYASDKIDPLRGYDSSYMVNECIDNIEVGFKLVLSENIRFLKENHKDFKNPLTLKCIDFYLGKGKLR